MRFPFIALPSTNTKLICGHELLMLNFSYIIIKFNYIENIA